MQPTAALVTPAPELCGLWGWSGRSAHSALGKPLEGVLGWVLGYNLGKDGIWFESKNHSADIFLKLSG